LRFIIDTFSASDELATTAFHIKADQDFDSDISFGEVAHLPHSGLVIF
jgi:hypothetical protein